MRARANAVVPSMRFIVCSAVLIEAWCVYAERVTLPRAGALHPYGACDLHFLGELC